MFILKKIRTFKSALVIYNLFWKKSYLISDIVVSLCIKQGMHLFTCNDIYHKK